LNWWVLKVVARVTQAIKIMQSVASVQSAVNDDLPIAAIAQHQIDLGRHPRQRLAEKKLILGFSNLTNLRSQRKLNLSLSFQKIIRPSRLYDVLRYWVVAEIKPNLVSKAPCPSGYGRIKKSLH
jgi:hypothetical protein